ncbi:taurine ABC transporter permease [bacterium]|nr:taurine ABC transporter permease [bacterium]|tara:strand:- start:36830 stop:37576 length:747 start_codon:yes stop_codon:yes gene_type:complete
MNKNWHTLIGPSVLIFIWLFVSWSNIIDNFLLPGPIETTLSLFDLIWSKEVATDFWMTSLRTIISFTITSLVGIPLGLALGSSEKLYQSFEFIIDFLRSMPATAVFPLFILIFGVTDASKIAVAVFASILIVIFNTAYGIMNASKLRILIAKIMGTNKLQMFRSVLFWESLPQTFVGLRVALNYCLILIVVAEMFIGTNVGLGRRIIDFQITYNIEAMYATILITGLLGYLLNMVFATLQNRLIHWNK